MSEQLLFSMPNVQEYGFQQPVNDYTSERYLLSLAREWQLDKTMRWAENDVSTGKNGNNSAKRVTLSGVYALIGALYVDQGPKAAREFVQRHVLSKNTEEVEKFRDEYPKARLRYMLEERDMDHAQFRLVSEADRKTHKSVYVVAAYSGRMAEGAGRSIREAENQVCMSWLLKRLL